MLAQFIIFFSCLEVDILCEQPEFTVQTLYEVQVNKT